jgi:hypothetical protein
LRRTFSVALLLAALTAGPAFAQAGYQEQVTVSSPTAPIPGPDPQGWWTDKWPAKPEALNPLGPRRLRRGERPPAQNIPNGVPPLLYRLWDLPPLQDQLVRGGETIVEVWARPSETVRQAVVRVTFRSDGRAFVQGRAGFGCCEPRIARFVEFDEELSVERAAAVRATIQDPAWGQPPIAEIYESDGSTVSQVCVNGVSYDANLVVANAARTLHRACSGEQVGSIAPILTSVLSAALGYDPRFDVIFPRGTDFSQDRRDYEALIARGGGLRAVPGTRGQPPDLVPQAAPEAPEDAPPTQ